VRRSLGAAALVYGRFDEIHGYVEGVLYIGGERAGGLIALACW
jgi:hypothetical protein